MKKLIPGLVFFCLTACQSDSERDYVVSPVPFTQVNIEDNFWLPRIETNRTITIPYSFKMCENTGRMDNFAIAAGLKEGSYCTVFPFDDTDVYKIIEGASYSLQTHPDPELEKYLDSLIQLISEAQEEDGYLMTWRTIDPDKPPTDWSGGRERWSNLDDGHELYNAGHMYEAAVAHYQATGKTSFMDIAIKNANLVYEVFGPGKQEGVPGHEEVEIGLVKLYRATGDERYLNLAHLFIERRGRIERQKEGSLWETGEYWQNHMPVVQQEEAIGHAVRAGYLYSGMADIAAMKQEENYLQALFKIWENVVSKKMYLTGGVGSSSRGEAFGDNYELPNSTAYAETCAAIANIFWNHRMFLLTGHSKYLDVLERTLYNGALSGISLEGNSFFYPNVLESAGRKRNAWFSCSCCPSNITRFIPSVPGYIYAKRQDTLFINLFIGSRTDIPLKGQNVTVIQKTNYPWDGKVSIQISTGKKIPFVVKIRIPGWAKNIPVPSDLYTYIQQDESNISLKINGTEEQPVVSDGFLVLHREWQKEDIIELNIPMSVQTIRAHSNVKADSGRVALERGPIVYCAEGIDNNGEVLDLHLSTSTKWQAEYNDSLLHGVTVLKGQAYRFLNDDKIPIEVEFKAIPYYAWAHREEGEMAVWFKTIKE